MAKRLTKNQKEEIALSFQDGINVSALSQKYKCTDLTIIRNLERSLGKEKYKQLNERNKNLNVNHFKEENIIKEDSDPNLKEKIINKDLDLLESINFSKNESEFFPNDSFL